MLKSKFWSSGATWGGGRISLRGWWLRRGASQCKHVYRLVKRTPRRNFPSSSAKFLILRYGYGTAHAYSFCNDVSCVLPVAVMCSRFGVWSIDAQNRTTDLINEIRKWLWYIGGSQVLGEYFPVWWAQGSENATGLVKICAMASKQIDYFEWAPVCLYTWVRYYIV